MKKTLYEQLDIHETASHEVNNIGLPKAQPSKSEELGFGFYNQSMYLYSLRMLINYKNKFKTVIKFNIYDSIYLVTNRTHYIILSAN
jgi:hypothetical protein